VPTWLRDQASSLQPAMLRHRQPKGQEQRGNVRNDPTHEDPNSIECAYLVKPATGEPSPDWPARGLPVGIVQAGPRTKRIRIKSRTKEGVKV
jgi:hypothetical protein